MGQEIGTGTFGKVLRGKCRGKDVAIKVLHKPIDDEKTLTSFKKEVEIMSTIFHPNICLFMGACTQSRNFFIVSEFLPGGDVEKLLHDPKVELSLYQRMMMAKDAALGMNWLHCSNPNVIHRDLKTSNLLIDENGRVKVCDFGLSQLKTPGEDLKDGDSAKGTPLWMAPEVMQFRAFNEKSDVYSFGIVLWELLTRQEPFAHHNDYQTFRYAVCKKGERPPMPKHVEPRLKNLIERCWAAEPNDRPSFSDILKELDIILINVAIQDTYGRLFWTQKFLNSDRLAEAPWNKFAIELLQFLGIPIPDPLDHKNQTVVNLKCLRALLVRKHKTSELVKPPETVNIHDFGRLLNWFGPIASPDQYGHTFLDKISDTLRQHWFHGDVDKEQAESLLSGKPAGQFLIRFSSIDGYFTLGQATPERTIRHQRIEHRPGAGYVIGNHEYESLHDLVTGEGLTQACQGSMYQSIFQEKNFGYVDQMPRR
jgi:serine/threonine protein kinase